MIMKDARTIPSKVTTLHIDGKFFIKVTLKLEDRNVLLCFQVDENGSPVQQVEEEIFQTV